MRGQSQKSQSHTTRGQCGLYFSRHSENFPRLSTSAGLKVTTSISSNLHQFSRRNTSNGPQKNSGPLAPDGMNFSVPPHSYPRRRVSTGMVCHSERNSTPQNANLQQYPRRRTSSGTLPSFPKVIIPPRVRSERIPQIMRPTRLTPLL